MANLQRVKGRTRYAQTNIQLFDQLYNEGYSKTELHLVCKAYELAMHLFTGYYSRSGRPQIAHVVGTASILGSVRSAAEVVAAGLIHNVYQNGDFGDGRRGVSDPKRKQIRHAVGEKVEEYVYRFPALQLTAKTIVAIYKNLDALNPIERQVLLIQLADWLDHHLNLGQLYYSGGIEKYYQYMNHGGHLMEKIAEKLGFPTLATDLESIRTEPLLPEIYGELVSQLGKNRQRVIVPKSCCRRPWLILRQGLVRGVHRLSSTVGVRKALHSLVHRLLHFRSQAER